MASSLHSGSVSAIGIGVGAALAVSMGPVGFLVGLLGAFSTFLIGREVQRRRA